MSASAIVLAIVVPIVLWGGFALCLTIAIRREGRKTE